MQVDSRLSHESAQEPLEQTLPAAQGFAQVPQCALLVRKSAQEPSQSVSPARQPQLPPWRQVLLV